jgi:transposase
MPRTGRPKAELILTEDERGELLRWSRRSPGPQSLELRARIILACAQPGASNKDVAAALGIWPQTVTKWRARFLRRRLAGLVDEYRPGRPASVTPEQVDAVVTATLEQSPDHAARWSRSSMAKRSGLSTSTVGRIWRDFELRPHLADGLTVSADASFADKVVDVVGLYHNAAENAAAFCVDDEVTGGSAAFNIADTAVVVGGHSSHRAVAYNAFLAAVDRAVPDGLDVHLVCDNLATHKAAAIKAWLARRPRFHTHFIPSGFWTDQVERCFSSLPTRTHRRRAHQNDPVPGEDVAALIKAWREAAEPFVWTKSAAEIRASLANSPRRTPGGP